MVSSILRTGFLGFWALILALPGGLHAQPVAAKTHAVLVGIDTYSDAKIKPRRHAEADVKALYDVIVHPDHLNADPKNVQLLLGKKQPNAEQATRDNILKALDVVASKAGPDDLVLFAFFGQGCPLGEQVGLFGTDGTVADRTKTALNGSTIAKKFETLKAQRFCAFFDVNLNEFEKAQELVRDLDLRNLTGIVLGDQDVPAAKRSKGRVLFAASNGLTPTVQLEKHSLFAQTLVDAMKGKADKEGYEADGVITVNELAKYLDEELPRVARTAGKSKEEKSQATFVVRNPPTHFAVSRTSAAAVTEKRLARFTPLAKKAGVPPDVIAEGDRLLTSMPTAVYQQELRKNYQKFTDGKEPVAGFLKERQRIIEDSKLARKEATDYAGRIQRALDMITRNYVKEIDGTELASGAVRGLYQSAAEPIPADLEERLKNVKGLKKDEILDLLADAREGLRRREDLDRPKAEELTLNYVFSRHLDRYSYYVDADTVRKFKADTSGQYTGVGIQIRRDPARDLLMVVTPIKDAPAHKAGVMTGDWLVKITRLFDDDGKPLTEPEVISGEGLALDEAIKKIVGKAGTKVRLAFEREGLPKPVEFDIVRTAIKTESVFGVKRNKDDSWAFMLDDKDKIGYARLGSFTDYTDQELDHAITELKQQGMKRFILDLRFCPGGKLNTAFKVASIFIKSEPIVSVRYRGRPEQTIKGQRPNNTSDFPMAVLINRGSASASELVSACWQDHQRAVLIGDRSFGKGTIATYYLFEPTGGLLNLNTASFWRPSGKNLEKILTEGRDDEDWGVRPNEGFTVKLGRREETDLFTHLRQQEVIPRPDRMAKTPETPFRDVQLEKALEHLRTVTK